MKIRFAEEKDKLHAVRSLQRNQTFYNTTKQLKEDLSCGRLIVVEENGKLLGSCAIVPEKNWGYTAIKRLMVYSQKSRGKGIASALIQFVIELGYEVVGATPWEDNVKARRLFEKNGFCFKYQFGNYCYYERR